MQTIRLRGSLTDEAADKLAGEFIGHEHYDRLLQESADVYKPDGSPLIKFRKGVLPPELCEAAYPIIRRAAATTSNRGMAGGKVDPTRTRQSAEQSATRYRPLKRDGTISNTTQANVVESGVVGFMDRATRFPYCRMTAFHMDNLGEMQRVLPLFRAVNEVFEHEAPERYAAQLAKVTATHPDFLISGTAFTTVTVNRNFRTAVHKDAGDLKEGFGVMAVLEWGKYDGGYLVFPKFRVAVDLRQGDVLLADVHEWHGNTPLNGVPGRYERVSLVHYYRQHMFKCGAASEELERAKARQPGKLY
jgi:hypothetical protein